MSLFLYISISNRIVRFHVDSANRRFGESLIVDSATSPKWYPNKVISANLYVDSATIKRILSLHLLPPEKIPKMFHYLQEQILHLFETDLKDKKTDQTLLKCFLSYVDNNWIVGSVWPPIKWSVFNQPIRTNNDAEGWHNRVNGRMNPKMNFYVLLPMLHQEAKMIPLNKKLLCQDKIKKPCRKITACVNARLIE